ncbi:uncharacterized protein LOC114122668 isoform X2 [Aphis gossypii]|uniref:uncharacterized protein LOC114122668 isoform X2 n=1 Tax=Aphis gossypii TaxID=80765 RepID=UPI0021596F41|nr:uncharacterized protein LOC114122668 isoform X2 [Aphis gossypii]
MTASHKTAATVVVLLLACVLQGLCQEQKQGEGFKCPEEFGYYPHPNDCSQYYVCVFGGALLESCTGGLMYSHELQTCDWPRNVGCGAETTAAQPDNQENALALARSSDRQRHPSAQPQRATPSIFNQHHQVQDQQVNEQLVKQQQLYEEEDFRAIEDDSDRQQRVYRGQPSTLGQVARDRDGISKHRNIIPQFAGVEKNKQFQIPNQNYRNDTSKDNGKQRLKRQTRQSYSGLTRPRPTEMTMSTTNYALRKLPKDYRIASRPSSYVPITNTDNLRQPTRQPKRCLYESKIYPGLMIPCPTSRYRMPPYRKHYEESDDVYDQVDDENPGKNEEIEDKEDYPENPDNRENLQNQDEYEEENSQPLDADEQFEQLVTRVRCKGKKCIENNNNKYKNKENESQENEYENENESVNEEEESQEESPDSKEEEQKPKPKPKPKGINPNLHSPLAVVHNYQPANFTKIINRNKDGVPDVNQNKETAEDQEEDDDEEENSQESRLENTEDYNEGDDLQDDEYYYDDEEEYDQPPKKPKIPQKLTDIDEMKFKGEGDEPSESISKNTVLKNVSKTNDLHKQPNFESTQIPQRPKPYDSAAEAYTRVKDKNKPQDQQVMQMSIHETTVALNLVDEQKNKYKLPTKTDTTTVSAKYKPRPTIRPNILKRPQQISVPSYAVEQTVQPITTAKTTTSSSNRNETQYDPAFYSIYDDDSEIYKDVDYGQFTLSSVNNNNNRLPAKPQHQPQIQPQPQLQLQSQPQQDTFRVAAPLQQPTQRYQANTYVPEYNLKITEEEAQREQQTKATYRGRVRGGATYTTASSNDIDRGTPSVGRTRPTLKPSTSIVSKASEFVDVYKYAPARPDPIYPTPQPDKTAAKCRKDVCQLPDCSCGGKEIPGDLAPEETPQIVLLTFDDSVNDLNKGLYTDLFEKGRVNPNGCPISATFYVSHEWTDYSQVQNLYAAGHEIASHSVSHSFGEQFSQKKWTKEIVGQREILSAYGGVRQEDIRGMRAPFLAVGGNKMFKMLYDSNFTYDSSMPIYENKPPSWPYTLDYKLFHDCMIPPCPTRSYPGVWEVPMVMWQDLNGGRCSMGDACSNPSDADGVQKMLMKNFDRHFTSNRAPFGLFYHAAWFTQPHHKEGFIKFLDNIVSMPEVWIVTNWQAIQWVRDPTSISRLQSFTPFHCDLSERPKKCNNPKVCNLWHKSGVRYMRTCQPCPDIYPWTGKTGIRSSRIDDGSE